MLKNKSYLEMHNRKMRHVSFFISAFNVKLAKTARLETLSVRLVHKIQLNQTLYLSEYSESFIHIKW